MRARWRGRRHGGLEQEYGGMAGLAVSCAVRHRSGLAINTEGRRGPVSDGAFTFPPIADSRNG